MADADTVPALPIRTRVATKVTTAGRTNLSSPGVVLASPTDSSNIGKFTKRWADFTPATNMASPTTVGAMGFGAQIGATPTMSPQPAPSPMQSMQLFDKTPTPMDAPYYHPGFGFGLPTTTSAPTVTTQLGSIAQAMPFMQTMQPMQTMGAYQPMQTMNGLQQVMCMPGQAPTYTYISSAGAVPATMGTVVQEAGQQMMIVGMVPISAATEIPAEDMHDVMGKAGRQLMGEALNSDVLDRSAPAAPLPSPGSALHGTGRCNPCAWFYKPKGCLNAVNCSYCHLCPEGELKNRKKAKVTAMRMGALESVEGAPPQIKLTALLGD